MSHMTARSPYYGYGVFISSAPVVVRGPAHRALTVSFVKYM